MVNSSWATDVCVLTTYCSLVLEMLTIKARPFYLPREFSSVLLTAVYIPPQADKSLALDELYNIVNRLENSHPEAAFIVLGDFNRANMKKVLPKYHQHIRFPTRQEQTLDHCYTPFRDCYKALPRPAFGKADHCSILLLPAYRQKLKQEKPVSRVVYKWNKEADEVLQDCFETTDSDGNINAHTDSVIGYISKCIDDVVPKVTIRTYHNQKPWVGQEIRAKLKARANAFNSGDPDAYKVARYDLWKSIRDAKRNYRDKVESNYYNSDPRRMWSGLRYITDYKGKTRNIVLSPASLPDDLNTFYARFDADDTAPAMRPYVGEGADTLTLEMAIVRRTFKKVNPRKAPGPDGIPGRVLRVCADQLAEVFTKIFNLSLSQSVVPTPFKSSNIIFKYADDTTILGLITDNNETAYREEVKALNSWCQDNNLSLNVSKTKEMIVDYRRQQGGRHLLLYIGDAEVERVRSFKFLGVHITEDLSWTLHTDTVTKKAHQRLYF
ncbi:hypothetical protein LDENG_00288860, partial [Lucifuga dentata]